MVVPFTQKVKPNEKVPQKILQVPLSPDFLDIFIWREIEGRKFEALRKGPETFAGLWEGALNDTELLNELKGFDLIVYDSMAFCGLLVGELLGIPRVEILPFQPNLLLDVYHMAHTPISYVPQLVTGFTDKMTFMERLMNLGAYLSGRLFVSLKYERILNALKVKYNIKPERSSKETVGTLLVMLNWY